MESIIEISLEDLYKDNPVAAKSIPVAVSKFGGYKLLSRLYHGFTEKARVFQFKKVCDEALKSKS